MSLLAHALLLIFPLAVIAAAITDATRYIIPNRLSAALALAFMPAALAAGLPLPAVGLYVAVGAAALAAGVVLFAFRVIGGGDAKLAAACTLWLGPVTVMPFLLWTAVAGGALAVGLLIGRRMPGSITQAGPGWVSRLLQRGSDVPYGVAIAVGALAVFPLSPLARLVHR